jgi:anti-sigma regulatory factor (Ser/Thr protein kinase)
MSETQPRYTRSFHVRGKDFRGAGSVSTAIKAVLRGLGFAPDVVRRAAIASYEAEMNVVIYAFEAEVTFAVESDRVEIVFQDRGPGIADVNQAMQEGFSTAPREVREMGFGAGMGLPNIRRNSDSLDITTTVGEGTRVAFEILTAGRGAGGK